MVKVKAGTSKLSTNAKVQNKKGNKEKRTSYRVEKETRKAARYKAGSHQITANVGGETVQVSATSKQGKKILAKQKRRAQEQKSDRLYTQRNTTVAPDTIAPTSKKQQQPSTTSTTGAPKMTSAQLEIQEMMERAKRTQQMDEQLADLRSTKPPRDTTERRLTKSQQKKQKLDASKDYEDEEEIQLDTSVPAVSDVDSDEYSEDDSDQDDNDYMGDDDSEESEQLGDSSDSDYEVRNKYRDQHATLIKNTQLMGNRKDVRAAMIETLYDDLPKYTPIPAKMAALMKSKGQSVKEIEKQRKADHDLKIKRILAERERRIREYDSDDESSEEERHVRVKNCDGDDDDDDDDDDGQKESDADYFLRLLKQKHERKVQRREEQLQSLSREEREAELERLHAKRAQKKALKKQAEIENKRKRMGMGSDEDLSDVSEIGFEDSDLGSEYSSDSEGDNEKSVNLVTLKQQTQAQRAAARKEMKQLWLTQREERIQAAKERTARVAGIPLPVSIKNIEASIAPVTAETLTKKAQLKQLQQRNENQQERLMVLLDDGTWGYREDGGEQAAAEVVKPDLSAYIRKPKEPKKSIQQLKREEKEKADDDAPNPFEDGKSSDALDKFQQFLENDKPTQLRLGPKQPSTMTDDLDEDAFLDVDEDDEDDELEFESDQGDDMDDMDEETVNSRLRSIKASIHPQRAQKAASKQSKQIHDDDGDDDLLHLNDLDRITLLERKKMKQQMSEINTLHTSRLDRIRQVQLILAQLCTELLENPNKYVVAGHLEALLKLCKDKDSTIQQLAIASASSVFHDIIPDFRLREHKNTTHTNDGITRLSKEVRLMRTYDNTFLQHYRDLLTIINKNVHKGLSLFYAKQHRLWQERHKVQSVTEVQPQVSPYEEYKSVNIDFEQKQSTLYTISLQSACTIFSRAYGFNFNTQIAHLLAHVLTSDDPDWADIVTTCVADVFKRDKCGDATLEIVQTIGEVCKKRTGDKIRSPLLSVLLEIPFNPQVIHYKDPNKARKDAKAKEEEKKRKKADKIKGVTGVGHHYAEKQRQLEEKTQKQMKKAMRSGKEYQGPDPNSKEQLSLKEIHDQVQRSMRESEAIVSIEDRQKLQTKSLSVVFTIFFRYLKQAPTIKTLYNYNTVNQEHQHQYEAMKMAHTAQSTVHKSADILSIPKEHRNQVILTQTMLGVVTPPTHFVLAIVLRGIMKFGQLINVELVLDLLQHLLMVIQAATSLESLSISSSLLAIECIFTLLQMHGSAIDIDLAPHYQVLYNIVWQLIYHPEYSFLMIKCIDLAIIHRKHLPFRRVAAIVRRLYQVAMHLPPHFALPLIQIAAQCCTAHPTIGAIYDNDKLQSGLYDLDHPQPDTSDAIATPAWESLAQMTCAHPYAANINLHALLSDLRIGSNTNMDGKTVGNSVDRSQLSISLTTIELPNQVNRLERPQRITRQVAISRLKPLELYSAIDVSKGGFCPDVEAPDAKKLRKLIHYEWYDKHNWLSQVEELKSLGMFNHYDTAYQSSLMNQIMGGQTTVTSFLQTPLDNGDDDDDEYYYEEDDDDEYE